MTIAASSNGRVAGALAGPVSGRALVGRVELAYETFGDPSDPAMLLIMGLGTQMIAWPDELCQTLAAGGRYVVRFDNRDVGLSSHLSELAAPAPPAVLLRLARAPYSIVDMARDVEDLIATLDLTDVDVVGASMGGFIAQALAIRWPRLVRTLTLIMTSTGSPRVGLPHPKAFGPAIFRRPPVDRADAVEMSLATFRRIGSPGFPLEEDRIRDLAWRSLERSFNPDGVLRQMAACLRQADRTECLRRLDVPALVIHGLSDPLVSPSGGLAVANAIQGSTFLGFPGMGHDLPSPLWDPIAEQILALSHAHAS